MKNVVIEISDDGKRATISYEKVNDEGQTLGFNKITSLIGVYLFLQNEIFQKIGGIGKRTIDSTMELTLGNKETLKLINLNDKNILKAIDENIFKAYKFLIPEICKFARKNIYISEKEDSFNFAVDNSYYRKVEIMLPLDKEGNLTNISRNILDILLAEVFDDINPINTSVVLSTVDKKGILRVHCGSTGIETQGKAAEYIAPTTNEYASEFYEGGFINGKHYNG